MQIINVGFDNVEKIIHIADIHIRNYKRHTEYRQVFEQLYEAEKKKNDSSRDEEE